MKKGRWASVSDSPVRVLRTFRESRESLLAEWNTPPKQRESKPKPSRQERNAVRAASNLAAWERKLKLAKTKVSKYRKQVRYYERVAASRAKEET